MDTVTRGIYIFRGQKAEKSAEYYDIVLSHGYSGDMNWLAYDAAQKFGNRMIMKGVASFLHGTFHGERAEEASEYFDRSWKEAFDACPQEGRRKHMAEILNILLLETEKRYHVTSNIDNPYYY